MNTFNKVLVYVALGLSVIAILSSGVPSSLFGAAPNISCNGRAYCTAFNDLKFRNASSTGTFDASAFTASSSVTLSGTNTFSGTNTLSGATVISGTAQVLQTTSSTLKIGTGVGNITGCLELGDSSSASTTVYITASGATVSATTTKPAVCR